MRHQYAWRERGQGLVEYSLILGLVAILAIAALVFYGSAIGSSISNMSGSV